MKIVTISDLAKLVKQHTFKQFLFDLMKYLKEDYSNWENFDKSPRHAIHVEDGVIEVMPIADKKYYSFKYVNGHPKNPKSGKLTVIATGQLSQVENGYPLLFSEMTLLTAFRTAANAAIGTELFSRKESKTLALIGNGAQSEFQVLANCLVRNIETVKYYDTDPKAMEKFKQNIQKHNLKLNLIPCKDVRDATNGADIITICTAAKGHFIVLPDECVKSGVHINALGGDCPGKTELDTPTLFKSKVVVEYTPQTRVEGEIQRLTDAEVEQVVHAEIWEVITGKKDARANPDEITLFQSVGFALQDYSVLRLVNDLANKYKIGQELDLIPGIEDPKNLISLLD